METSKSEYAKPTDRVFWHGLASYTGLNRDMQRANIPLVDELGRSAGFHTFRRTFITLGHNEGVAPRLLQELARHKSLHLTNDIYADTTKFNLRAAVEKMGKVSESPILPSPLPLNSGQNGISEANLVPQKNPQMFALFAEVAGNKEL